jgi:Domain of unknown function (DUF4385)
MRDAFAIPPSTGRVGKKRSSVAATVAEKPSSETAVARPSGRVPMNPNIDYREHPEQYRIGSGEEGVLTVEPYKGELLPLWRFQTPQLARLSSHAILEAYGKYKAARDFVGMDMARKFLQMGWTRSRRYANHRSGRKYDGPVPLEHRGQSGSWGRDELPHDPDPEKARCAAIFYEAYRTVLDDAFYQVSRGLHLERHERVRGQRQARDSSKATGKTSGADGAVVRGRPVRT